MLEYLDLLHHGAAWHDLALFANRTMLGTFFAISGYHKLFNAGRHRTLVKTLQEARVPLVGFNQWFVPTVEFLGGLSLLAGILAPFAASGLAVICLVACLTDGVKRIASWQPINRADYVDDVLYLPETLYLFGLVVVMLAGPGAWTLVNLVL